MDWLITRILGVDHALVILREEVRCSRPEMVRRIQQVNPGWTSNWAPRLILKELREFNMLDWDSSDVVSLSDAGREWRNASTGDQNPWRENRAEVGKATSEDENVSLSLPAFPEIRDEVSNHGHFPEPLIRKLHSGVWANKRRHFAVLTGLSGSGRRYSPRPTARQSPVNPITAPNSRVLSPFNPAGTILRVVGVRQIRFGETRTFVRLFWSSC